MNNSIKSPIDIAIRNDKAAWWAWRYYINAERLHNKKIFWWMRNRKYTAYLYKDQP